MYPQVGSIKQLKQHFTVHTVILILLRKNLRFREDEKLGQMHTVSKWQRWNLNQSPSDSFLVPADVTLGLWRGPEG